MYKEVSQTELNLHCWHGSLHTWLHKAALDMPGPAWFTFYNIQQWSLICLLIATNLLSPEGWMVCLTVSAPENEPGPTRLMVQEIRRRNRIHSAMQTDNNINANILHSNGLQYLHSIFAGCHKIFFCQFSRRYDLIATFTILFFLKTVRITSFPLSFTVGKCKQNCKLILVTYKQYQVQCLLPH